MIKISALLLVPSCNPVHILPSTARVQYTDDFEEAYVRRLDIINRGFRSVIATVVDWLNADPVSADTPPIMR